MRKWLFLVLVAIAALVSPVGVMADAATSAPMTLSLDWVSGITFPAFGSEEIFAAVYPGFMALRGSLTLPGLSYLP